LYSLFLNYPSHCKEEMSLSNEDLDKMNFDYKQHLVFNYVMVDVDSKKNVNE